MTRPRPHRGFRLARHKIRNRIRGHLIRLGMIQPQPVPFALYQGPTRPWITDDEIPDLF